MTEQDKMLVRKAVVVTAAVAAVIFVGFVLTALFGSKVSRTNADLDKSYKLLD